MVPTSPRLDPRLVLAAFDLDRPEQPAAKTWRAVGAVASELGLPRPGYDTVRRLVVLHRARRAEIRRLLGPVVNHAFTGYPTAWDVDRAFRALEIARADRAARRR